jgi:alcohol dehydrogenase class IV
MPFDFYNVPRIVFGRGTIARRSEFVPAGARVLLVHNGPAPALQHAQIFHQRGEPTVTSIDRAMEAARSSTCDFVIGYGGGSAIDAAKAVAGLLANGGAASDYMEVVGKGQKITRPALPWIAIPTTAGTGAEVTRNAVVGWPEKKFKASIRSELLLPRVALIDPELGVHVPPDVTARTGMDALCQCIEAYVSKNANPMTDALAIKGVELAAGNLKRAFENGHDLEAREGMAMAALLGGIALTNAGLGAVHGFAAPLGAKFPIPHGTICGVLLPHVIGANRAAGVIKYGAVDQAIGEDAAEFCATLVNDLKLPPLGHFGITRESVPAMVELAKRASSMRYNPVALDESALEAIISGAISA